ncbi:translocation/assembly module TamB domain-containing protein [Sphingomonas sp. CFBP 13720]|uniref:translocation/assembly module TamB domain-containing protein n=1 Tax=Sphingomonas sp. CFBP 13720 TaxID=2775302 RepID=UPI001781399C|nr:translocation/assembly module TamB domain-containing protein [Sphingomonas sp. CFBP 13720]MBD8677065.1 translocation/assembly module TamB domain-containing protein [Sphingomonas sp. CFBP 13720]
MADDLNPVADTATGYAAADHVAARRPLWLRIVKWIGIVLAGLILIALVAVFGINTDPGRRFLVGKLDGYTTASGLKINIGRIDGSLYGAMTIRDLRLSDTRGVFADSPAIAIDWRPFAFANGHVDIRSLTSPLVRYVRNPVLKDTPPGDPNAPLLPDYDIDVNRLKVDRIEVGAAVTGQRHIARIDGQVHIADRRAQLAANAATIAAPGVAGGDRIALKLDAVPDDNRFDVQARVTGPQNGMIAGMAGLTAPIAASIDGRGDWANWQGRLAGTLGGRPLANLAITGRDGRFTVRGSTQPGLILQGPVERLTAPRLDVAIDAALADRKADTRIRLRSSALAVDAAGLIDLGNSRFGNFRTEAMLLTPGAIAPNLNGRSVRAAVVLDGGFGTPTVDYKVQAAAIGFGEIAVEQLYAEGRATVDADRILIPIAAKARRITGLNAAVGGLVTNVAINGDLAISGDQVLSDNLRIRSDRIDATAIVAANLTTGRYTGAIKGRINEYEVASIGILNLSTDASLYAAPQGGFGIKGRVVAQTTRLFNDGVRNFLGGNVSTTRVDVGVDPDGIITFSNLRMNAPQFRITGGSGRYDPAGPLLVNADAYSTQYGPLSARVTGSVAAPQVLLRAARPGVGIGLVNLEARVRGQGDRYGIQATGGTNYGPFRADVLVATGPRLTADIRSATFAGVNFDGRVQATDAGPFTGRINFAGSGIAGVARLGAEGRYQRADVNARAYNAVIPGDMGLRIGRAIITASAVLYDQPAIVADAQVANLSMGDFVLQRSRAKINYRGGSGTAQAFAEGSSGVPFKVAANARLSPDQYLVALQGMANAIPFRTVNPARITPAAGGYRLYPTRIDFAQGSIRAAGVYGNGMSIQTRLDRLDLGIINAFVPGTGVGGTATGSLDFAEAAGQSFPRADARLTIRNFQRTSLASVSEPVDIVFAGDLRPEGGTGRALVRRGTTTVGRMVANLTPLPPGSGSWVTRMLAAPLSGGIRYNGPAAVLFSFTGFADQQLSGPIGIAADFAGRVQAPQLTGVVRANNLTYENEALGTRLTNVGVNGRFTNDRFELVQFRAKAGEGTVAAQGSVGLAANSGFPIDIRAQLRNAQLASSDALGASASGDIRIQNGADGGLISGELTIPEARYQIIRQGAADVAELTGVRRKSDANNSAAAKQQAAAAPPGLFRLALRIRADNRLFVSGMGLESEWEADLRIAGTSAAPTINGQLRLVRGTYSFAGKRFEVERGNIRFEGENFTNPGIDIAATTTAEGVTATINVTGTAQAPQIAFSSTPALAQDEVLSRLLFGSSVTNLSATEAIQLAAALNSLRGSGGGGLNPLGKLRSATGFDRLRVLGGDEATGRGTSLAAGKYLTDDIYLEVITDARGFTATQIQIALTRTLSVLSQTGSFGGSNASVRYSRDY